MNQSTSPSTHVFLTHDWGVDELKRNNHDRVALFNEGLKNRGWITWFDTERMSGDVHGKMSAGIDETVAVLVFITARYCQKVACGADDNCGMEFKYAHKRKTTKFMIPILMEPGMRETREWNGQLGMVLNDILYYDFTDDKKLEICLDEVSTLLMNMTCMNENDINAKVSRISSKMEEIKGFELHHHQSQCGSLIKIMEECLNALKGQCGAFHSFAKAHGCPSFY